MGKLKPLLDKQIIRIDDHNRGNGRPILWNDPNSDIHIHKQNINKGDGGYEIRIPINSNRKASFDFFRRQNVPAPFPKKIKKEISKVLDNFELRNLFLEDVYKTIEAFSWDHNQQNERTIINKIAAAFDIPIGQWQEIESERKKVCVSLSELNTQTFQVVLNYSSKSVIIGEFMPCSQRGLPKESYTQWTDSILNKFSDLPICNIDTLKRWLEDLSIHIPNIGKRTILNTAKQLYSIYAENI